MTQAIALDTAVLKVIRPAMLATWNYIGSDVEEMCDGDNEQAVEMCIDADRLLICGKDAAAHALVSALIAQHGYVKVLKFLEKHFTFA